MSTHKSAVLKKKTGLLGLVLLSLVLSFLVLYLMSIIFWSLYGYDKTMSFFISLLRSNQISMKGLGDTILSYPLIGGISAKTNAFFTNENVFIRVQSLVHAGTDGLKDGLSGFLNDDLADAVLASGGKTLRQVFALFIKAGWLFVLVLKIFLIKAFLLIAAIPLFALLGILGLIDGLSQREIRRAELGRESSYLFHMLNKWIAKIIGVGLCLWVCLPMTVNPQWFFVPLGLMFAVMLSLSASKFKKYL